MEEKMMITMMMINRRTTTFHDKDHSFLPTPTPTPTPTPAPTWKLYENPFYTSPQNLCNQEEDNVNEKEKKKKKPKQIHLLHLPVSTRKIASSFWDLTFIKPFMESELDAARAHIAELRAQLEHERKARRKAESANKKLSKEVEVERKGREALERVCEELAAELTSSKTDMNRLKIDMQEERKMLRVAEVLREERVQMKLSDAKIMLEEKISELEVTKMNHHKNDGDDNKWFGGNATTSSSLVRKVSVEAENPHIKRGIRGFVEFPRVVRAMGSRSRHLGSKLECQKAQLMILLKQKTQIQANNMIMS